MKNRRVSLPTRMTLALIPLLATAGVASAQDGSPDAADMSMWGHFQLGGPFMWVILSLSAGLVGLCVYNVIQLGRKRWVPTDLKEAIYDHMANCRVRSAIELASSSPAFFGRMLSFSLPKIDATDTESLGRDAVEDAMAEFVTTETREPVQWVNYLSTIMQAAPMLGLLGTVSGMVGAFAKLGQTGGASPAELAGNISEALYTTMFGLMVAVPSLIAYAIFKNLFNRRLADAVDSGKEMLDVCTAAVQGEEAFAKVPEGLHAE